MKEFTSPRDGRDGSHNRPPTLRVADESRESRETLASSLRCRGYTVVEAGDGEEARGRIAWQFPDFVLTGVDLCRSRKGDDRTRRVPVIILSSIPRTLGRADEHGRRRTGADAFLSEPYDPRRLYGLIDALLESRGAGPA